MTNKTDENEQEPVPFNPLAWGILFFSFWLSLQLFDKLLPLQQGIGWFSLFLSAVLFCSIFIPPLQKLLSKPSLSGFFVSLVFFVLIFAFAITLAQSWPNLADVPHLIYIAVIGGVLWFIAYLLVLVRMVSGLKKVGFWTGIAICIILIGIGIYEAITSDVLAGVILTALGIGSIAIVIKKPQIWHKVPF
jgi:hypothetical protein